MAYKIPPQYEGDLLSGPRGGIKTRTELERLLRALQREYLLMARSKIRISYQGVDVYCDTIQEATALLKKLVRKSTHD